MKLTLTDIANLENETSVINTINANNALIAIALENTLSRDGTSPNVMTSVLDMNSHRIINLPQPINDTEPLRLVDLQNISGVVSKFPAGGTTGQALVKLSNANFDTTWTTLGINPPVGTSNGQGVTVWRQTFTTSGTYVPTTGMFAALVEAVGAGGGGGASLGSSTQVFSGGGGGAGAYSRSLINNLTIGTGQTVTIATGGAGGSGGLDNAAAGSGGTAFGALVIAPPGQKGRLGSAVAFPNGGTGAVPGTGDIAASGANGTAGCWASSLAVTFPGGHGANTQWGGGGQGGYASAASAAGPAGTGYGSGGAGGVSHNTTTNGAGGAGAPGLIWVTEYCAQNVIPSASAPVIIQRISAVDWYINTPIVNGQDREFIQWYVRDIGPGLHNGATIQLFTLYGISTNENGSVRVQVGGSIAGAVFEYAKNVGRMSDPLNKWSYYGNGHGNVVYAGSAIVMDGGATNLRSMQIGSYVAGSSLSIQQTPNIYLPTENLADGGATPPLSVLIGNVSQTHVFSASGCLFTATHTFTATPGTIGEQNSYGAMLPTTGCNMIQFGSNSAFAFNTHPGSPVQTANQGQKTSVVMWDASYPLLKVGMSLPSGYPGLPDGWTQVTTSDTFAINNPTFAKVYMNSYSGNSTRVVTSPQTQQTFYRVFK